MEILRRCLEHQRDNDKSPCVNEDSINLQGPISLIWINFDPSMVK